MIVLALFLIIVLYIVGTFMCHYIISYKIEKRAPFCSKAKHLSAKKVCFVVAHPDDEVMFFGPIIRHVASFRNHRIHILCLTTGNYYGIGNLRRREMRASCTHLVETNLTDLEIVDEPSLPDHPTFKWNKDLCTQIISDYLREKAIDVVVSFDEKGVSSHANHCFLSNVLLTLRKGDDFANVSFYKLNTVGLLRKYMFLFDLIPTFLSRLVFERSFNKSIIAVSTYGDFLITIQSMMKHHSQLIWFRWLYIFSSRYMFINNLEKI